MMWQEGKKFTFAIRGLRRSSYPYCLLHTEPFILFATASGSLTSILSEPGRMSLSMISSACKRIRGSVSKVWALQGLQPAGKH